MRDYWPSARGWIALGTFALTVLVIFMLAYFAELRADEFFKTVATLIIGAFVKDVVGWAYGASQTGGELAQKNADTLNKTVGRE